MRPEPGHRLEPRAIEMDPLILFVVVTIVSVLGVFSYLRGGVTIELPKPLAEFCQFFAGIAITVFVIAFTLFCIVWWAFENASFH